ncbi:DUF4351 domain-containing protein [Polyangium sp. y55x31]|uniref:DUF4351 domain-containing protein n=1 Tax=Polyangium sp. y55x31 TaxID=3042688 RepID=UPI0024823167|nr:DUF4351 domain-containing protein [Polyangium sp. y55x31]MDI1480017.1 DUF4351 domain-containing protein [Polyangium sp. y55x31]
MHNRYDQAYKQILCAALEPSGVFGPEIEVSPDPQRVDGFYVPDPARPSPIASTLLGRMGRAACTFEVFSETPDDGELIACVRKHLNLRHILSGKDPPVPLPRQWILSSGRPQKGLRALGARRERAWPSGVYAIPSGFATSIVAANELPEERSTLLLRLMGRGRTLRRAIAELRTLGDDDFERCTALPILVRFRIEAASGPVTPSDEEFLMSTQDVLEMWERRAEERGAQRGLREGQRSLLLQLLRRRFGELPPAVVARVEAADTQALESFAARLLVAKSADEVVADE